MWHLFLGDILLVAQIIILFRWLNGYFQPY